LYAQSSRLTNWLSALAFTVLIAFCVIGVGAWRMHNPAFVSVHGTNPSAQLQSGDAVMTRIVKLTDLQPGDIVSFYNPQDTTSTSTVRVGQVDRANRTFTPVSDTNKKSQAVDSSLLIGKVEYRLNKLGYVLNFVHSRIGLIIGAYLPALFIVGQELKQLAIAYDRPTYRLLTFSRRA
jgi:hypothetical protein